MGLAAQIQRLGKHSVIYGLGGLIQRIVAVLLLPLYTRYLSPRDYGAIEVLVALSAVVFALLRAGIQSSFFRFYFQAEDERGATDGRPHLVLVHDGRGDDRARRGPRARGADLDGDLRDERLREPRPRRLRRTLGLDELRPADGALPRRGAIGELLDRSLANVLLTVGATILLVVVLDKGPIGVLVGNFSGTLAV